MQTDRQREIINASLDLISEKGLQGFTLRNLAQRIGVTEPAIYRHYDNKIQILLAILEHFRKSTTRIFDDGAALVGSAIEQIDYIFSNQFRVLAETPQLVSVIFSEELFRNEPLLKDYTVDLIAHIIQSICDVLKKGQEQDEIRADIDPRHLAILIVGGLRLFLKRWQIKDFSFDLRLEGASFLHSVKQIIL